MSSGKIITVENLGKKYRIRHDDESVTSYVALRDVITDRAKNLFRWNGNRTPTTEDFWALKQENYGVASSGRMPVIFDT